MKTKLTKSIKRLFCEHRYQLIDTTDMFGEGNKIDIGKCGKCGKIIRVHH